MKKTRYAICGLSARAIGSYIFPLKGIKGEMNQSDFSSVSEIVGIMDIDPLRVSLFCEKYGVDLPFYPARDGVSTMIERARPDVLIVAGPDYTHCEHILAGLEHDLRVIAEKPLVINCAEMREVMEAERRSKGSLVAAHNYRYTPINTRLKRLIQSGRIGSITNIEFIYNLDTLHGPSYFQRWNRIRSKSGGLTIHKSVHHLDLINWLTGARPRRVFAFGGLNYFGPNGFHNPCPDRRSSGLAAKARAECPYFQRHYAGMRAPDDGRITIGWDSLQIPYDVQYPDDAYIYDEEIDVEDTYSAVVEYDGGISMTFSCNFSTPWEGYKLAINGSLGRIEAAYHTIPEPEGNRRPTRKEKSITLMPLFGGCEAIPVDNIEGGHGGSDPLIQQDLFSSPQGVSLELGLPANSTDAALAIATGEAIWRSAKEGVPYDIDTLLAGCS